MQSTARARPRRGPRAVPDLSSVEWSIALTSRLLLSKYPSQLSQRRPVVERRLCRMLGRWRSPEVSCAIGVWRRAARAARRATLSVGLRHLIGAAQARAASKGVMSRAIHYCTYNSLRVAFSEWRHDACLLYTSPSPRDS